MAGSFRPARSDHLLTTSNLVAWMLGFWGGLLLAWLGVSCTQDARVVRQRGRKDEGRSHLGVSRLMFDAWNPARLAARAGHAGGFVAVLQDPVTVIARTGSHGEFSAALVKERRGSRAFATRGRPGVRIVTTDGSADPAILARYHSAVETAETSSGIPVEWSHHDTEVTKTYGEVPGEDETAARGAERGAALRDHLRPEGDVSAAVGGAAEGRGEAAGEVVPFQREVGGEVRGSFDLASRHDPDSGPSNARRSRMRPFRVSSRSPAYRGWYACVWRLLGPGSLRGRAGGGCGAARGEAAGSRVSMSVLGPGFNDRLNARPLAVDSGQVRHLEFGETTDD